MNNMDCNNSVVLSFSVDSYHGPRMGRHNMMLEMSKYLKVIFCRQIFTADEVREKLFKTKRIQCCQMIKNNFYSFDPGISYFSTYRHHFVNHYQFRRYANKIKKEFSIHENNNVILYIWHPSLYWVLDCFRYDILIYHIYDDYASYSDMSSGQKDRIRKIERNIIDKCDLVFSTHPSLLDNFETYGKGFFVGNGVDFELFNSDRSVAKDYIDIEKDAKDIIIGYVGRITSKLDFELLADLLDLNSNLKLVLVGPIVNISKDDMSTLDLLLSKRCVYWFGEKRVEDLPSYINGLDVCLLPYKIGDNHVHSIYPLKLHEYFSCGKPVMATIFNKFLHDEFSDSIIWGGVEKWSEALSSRELLNELSRFSEDRINIARNNSWKRRVDVVLDHVAQIERGRQ